MPVGSHRFPGITMASKKLSKLKKVAREYNRHPAGAPGSKGGQFAPKNRSGALGVDALSSGPSDNIPPGKAKFLVKNGEIILSSGKRVVPNKKLKDGTIILGREELKALKKEILDPLPEPTPTKTKKTTKTTKAPKTTTTTAKATKSNTASTKSTDDSDVIPPGKARFVVKNGEIILSSGKRIVPNKKLEDGTIILGKEELKALKKEVLDPLPEPKPKEANTKTQSPKSEVKPNIESSKVERLKKTAERVVAKKEETENTAQKENQKNKLPSNHLITANPRYDANSLDAALDSLTNNGAQERVRKFREFVRIHEIQSIFIDKSKSSDANFAVVKDKLNFQRLNWKDNDARLKRSSGCDFMYLDTADGFTGYDHDHLVTRTESKGHEKEKFNPDSKILNSVVKSAITKAESDTSDREWTYSLVMRKLFMQTGDISDADTANFLAYLHEMGHQVQFKAGMNQVGGSESILWAPTRKHLMYTTKRSITKYGDENVKEFFAESFVAWILDADSFAKYDPAGAKFIEETLDIALKASTRKDKIDPIYQFRFPTN